MEIEIGTPLFWMIIAYQFYAPVIDYQNKDHVWLLDNGYIEYHQEFRRASTTPKSLVYLRRIHPELQSMELKKLYQKSEKMPRFWRGSTSMDWVAWTAMVHAQAKRFIEALFYPERCPEDFINFLQYFGYVEDHIDPESWNVLTKLKLTSRGRDFLKLAAEIDSSNLVNWAKDYPKLDDLIIQIIPKREWTAILGELAAKVSVGEYTERYAKRLREQNLNGPAY
jgi:hypothetical protein